MTISTQADRVFRKALRRKALTAGQLAERAGFASGRTIARAIGILVNEGSLIVSGTSRYPTYTKTV